LSDIIAPHHLHRFSGRITSGIITDNLPLEMRQNKIGKQGWPKIGYEDGVGSAKEDAALIQVSPMSSRARFKTAIFALSGAALLAGCAEEPFVVNDYRFHQRGTLSICYNEKTTTMAQLKTMADEVCRPYDRTSALDLVQQYQCTWTAPTQARFSCVSRPGETPRPFSEHLSPMRHDPSIGPM
jgi:hypothetical protein